MRDWFELLECPRCRSRLKHGESALICIEEGHTFGVRDGAPVFELDGAESQHAPGPLGRAAAAVVALPQVYDVVQRLAGARRIFRRIEPMLADFEGTTLDVGAGTGSLAAWLPMGAQYLWLDSDPHKLAGFRRLSNGPALLADATRLPFQDGAIDWAGSAFVLHHLDDEQLEAMLAELQRVSRRGLFLLDAVAHRSVRSRALWRYDRGRHPRTPDSIRRAVSQRFTIVEEAEFDVLHRYVALTATPLPLPPDRQSR